MHSVSCDSNKNESLSCIYVYWQQTSTIAPDINHLTSFQPTLTPSTFFSRINLILIFLFNTTLIILTPNPNTTIMFTPRSTSSTNISLILTPTSYSSSNSILILTKVFPLLTPPRYTNSKSFGIMSSSSCLAALG